MDFILDSKAAQQWLSTAKTRRHLGSMFEYKLWRHTLEKVILCLNQRKLMLQGTFSSCLLYCFWTLRAVPLYSMSCLPKGGLYALSKLSRISRNMRLSRSGHLIYLKLSALSFDLAEFLCIFHDHYLILLHQKHRNYSDFFLVSRNQSVLRGNT